MSYQFKDFPLSLPKFKVVVSFTTKYMLRHYVNKHGFFYYSFQSLKEINLVIYFEPNIQNRLIKLQLKLKIFTQFCEYLEIS